MPSFLIILINLRQISTPGLSIIDDLSSFAINFRALELSYVWCYAALSSHSRVCPPVCLSAGLSAATRWYCVY